MRSDNCPWYRSSKKLDLNEALFDVIPVLYGAVLSYGLYVLGQMFSKFIVAIDGLKWDGSSEHTAMLSGLLNQLFLSLIVFLGMIFFLMKDIGELVKLSKRFPFVRSSRYLIEVIIACCYLAALALIDTQNYTSFILFGIAILLGAVSQNKFKNEYISIARKNIIVEIARTQATFHVIGGSFILLEVSFFSYYGYPFKFQWVPVWIFFSILIGWIIIYDFIISLMYGEPGKDYIVNLVPTKLLRKCIAKRGSYPLRG